MSKKTGKKCIKILELIPKYGIIRIVQYVITLHRKLEEFRDLKGAFIIMKRFIAILLAVVMCLSM